MIHKKSRHDYIHAWIVYVMMFFCFIYLAVTVEPASTTRLGGMVKKEQNNTTPTQQLVFKEAPFQNISITAKSYIVYDIVDKKIIASRDENKVLPLASVTKIMTALTALSMTTPETEIIVGNNSRIGGGYDLGLKQNQSWRLDELLKYVLTFSSNDGAYAVANHFGMNPFIKRMNDHASLISPTLSFTNPAGLDNGVIAGGSGSAYDVARMMILARKIMPSILDATTHARTTVTTEQGQLHGVPNTNQSIVEVLRAEASKTGYTDNAGGNLALVTDISIGHPVVIVVLGSTRLERFTDVLKLYKALLTSIE